RLTDHQAAGVRRLFANSRLISSAASRGTLWEKGLVPMDSPSRRKFFFLSTAAAAGMSSALRGADDKVAVAVIGLGGRGRDHMNSYLKLPDARIVALCDVDQAALERGHALVEKATGQKPKGYADMRQVFDDKSVQAVSM